MWQERPVALVLLLATPESNPPLGFRVSGKVQVLGRGAGADIRFPEPTVSPRHACLKKRGQAYLLSDEGSTNGTAIVAAEAPAPVYLAPGSPRLVRNGDRIVLGHVELLAYVDTPPNDIEIVELLEDLPARVVRRALEQRGLNPSEEELALALRELEDAADENLHALPPEPPPIVPVDENRDDPRTTDWVLAIAALLVLAAALWGLLVLLRGDTGASR